MSMTKHFYDANNKLAKNYIFFRLCYHLYYYTSLHPEGRACCMEVSVILALFILVQESGLVGWSLLNDIRNINISTAASSEMQWSTMWRKALMVDRMVLWGKGLRKNQKLTYVSVLNYKFGKIYSPDH